MRCERLSGVFGVGWGSGEAKKTTDAASLLGAAPAMLQGVFPD